MKITPLLVIVFLAYEESQADTLQRLTYRGAVSHCESGIELSRLPQTPSSPQPVHPPKSYWLPVRRNILGGFHWTDNQNTLYDDWVDSARVQCGSLDASSEIKLRALPCSSLWLGHICESHLSCSSISIPGYEQLSADNRCFLISFNKRLNWYAARWRCQQEGLDLAVLQTEAAQEELSEMIRKRFDLYHYWVGVRNNDWILDLKGNQSGSIDRIRWDEGQPKNHGNCVTAHRKRQIYAWKTQPCSSRHYAPCRQIAKPGINKQNRLDAPSNRKRKQGYKENQESREIPPTSFVTSQRSSSDWLAVVVMATSTVTYFR